MIAIHPLGQIGEIGRGDALDAILSDALESLDLMPPEPGDVLVVTQKIVSKAEGRLVDLASVRPGDDARRVAATTGQDVRIVQLALEESTDLVRVAPRVMLCRHRLGLVMANAGIDQSNTGTGEEGEHALLLPVDPDGSAAWLHASLSRRFGASPAIVISDSFGRPWRHGVTGVAIGAAGVPALVDARGDRDRDGRVLQSTLIALGDMVATAAGLATGEGAEGIPAAYIRGVRWSAPDRPARDLVRPLSEDLFR